MKENANEPADLVMNMTVATLAGGAASAGAGGQWVEAAGLDASRSWGNKEGRMPADYDISVYCTFCCLILRPGILSLWVHKNKERGCMLYLTFSTTCILLAFMCLSCYDTPMYAL